MEENIRLAMNELISNYNLLMATVHKEGFWRASNDKGEIIWVRFWDGSYETGLDIKNIVEVTMKAVGFLYPDFPASIDVDIIKYENANPVIQHEYYQHILRISVFSYPNIKSRRLIYISPGSYIVFKKHLIGTTLFFDDEIRKILIRNF